MSRNAPLYLSLSLLCASGILLSLNSCGGNSAKTIATIPPGKFQHVVIIFQENRTPDNLFHDSLSS